MSILNLIREILYAILKKLENSQGQSNFKGDIMYIVKTDNPDVSFNVNFTVTDSEGNTVPEDSVTVTVESDNEDAVSVTADETGRTGTIHFGNPGLANLNVTVEGTGGNLLGSFGAQFTTTVGDANAIAGGEITFDGLTEA
jgi:hypothetical protein